MAKVNIAKSGTTAIQVGTVTGKAAKPPKPTSADKVKTTNVVLGNAKVGRQVDVIRGGLTIRM